MPDEPVKSKAELKAERRALQEAQRAAKQAKAQNKNPAKAPPSEKPTSVVPLDAVKHKGKQVAKDQKTETDRPITAASNEDKAATETISNKEKKGAKSVDFPQIPIRKQETNRVHLFRHLKEPNKLVDVIAGLGLGSRSPIHPTFLALGVNLDEGRIQSANEACLCFLDACEVLIVRHVGSASNGQSSLPDEPVFARSFASVLHRHINFLSHCRPLAVTVRNTYQFLKQTLNQLDSVDDWDECRTKLLSAIEEFRQNIYLADLEISERASASIRPGECVCTLGYSSVVARVLERAWNGNIDGGSHTTMEPSSRDGGSSPKTPFSVLVVDTRPRFEGRRMLARLAKIGIPCEYTHIGALPCLAHKVSLALVGADALLNNGYVLARIGTAQVANIVSSIAHAPTLVCAETYKFWERAHSDAFEFNELGDPDDLWRGPRGTSRDPNQGIPGFDPSDAVVRSAEGCAPDLSHWRTIPKLHLLHLTYDVLPPELVTAVVTEKGTLPTTSVPVVLRVKQASSLAI